MPQATKKLSPITSITAFFKVISKHWRPILYRNSVTFTNIIFTAVCLLLLIFKEFQDALFLSSVVILNIVIGTIQGLRAKIALEKLQILMTPMVKVLTLDGREKVVTLEEVRAGDGIKLVSGDQIPADGIVEISSGLEVNESLLTGESKNILKRSGDRVLAGSFAVAGSGTFRVQIPPALSFVAQMTAKIKQYTLNLSPIQRNLTSFIKYMSYVLVIVVAYILFRGLTAHELVTTIIKDIASITGTLVPQGLILATTIFFAYGAVRMFKRQVLLQEINSTEKMGRIKQLCVDKTGTLTENTPALDEVVTYPGWTRVATDKLMDGYIKTNKDRSQTAAAISTELSAFYVGPSGEALPFSSERKYGWARLMTNALSTLVVVGAPDILAEQISDPAAREWVNSLLNKYATQAKRLVLLSVALDSLQGKPTALQPVAMYILTNPLRPGTKEIIKFFQDRRVRIRVISGDNPQTVQAIALQAGIRGADMIATGSEMEKWEEEDYEERVPAYHLYARVKPEQKEKIISILKEHGFTAMVGDGANDALAIKKADLGVAMFDGAPATRQIAQVVLMNNSFAAFPDGVSLAETVITNIELIASIFFNRVTVGLIVFIFLAALGYTYPLSPRNVTLINYFGIGLPLLYWALFPAHKVRLNTDQPFLRTVLPFSLLQGTIAAIASTTAFLLGPEKLRFSSANVLVVLVQIGLGFWFFVLAPMAYNVKGVRNEKLIIKIMAALAAFSLLVVFLKPSLSQLFNLKWPGFLPFALAIAITSIFGYVQFEITKRWAYFSKKREKPKV